MNVYIWNNVEQASGNSHSDGGVVVFADSLEEARTIANAEEGCSITDEEQPDETRPCADGEKRVFIMPNAGCC